MTIHIHASDEEFRDYRAEVYFSYPKDGAEDELEEQLRDLMKGNNMLIQGGPVVFRIHKF